MPKKRQSKLDRFAKQIDEWFLSKEEGGWGLTLAEAQSKLSEFGCSISAAGLGKWWQQRQQQKMQDRILGMITSGGEQISKIEAAFAKNPAPGVETIIKLLRVIILQLSTQGGSDPRLLALADQMTNTVIGYLSAQTKAGFKERELKLSEEKFCVLILDKVRFREATRIANSNLSQEEKIAAMRRAMFADVDRMEESGVVKIPGRPGKDPK